MSYDAAIDGDYYPCYYAIGFIFSSVFPTVTWKFAGTCGRSNFLLKKELLMSIEFILRIIGMVVLALAGGIWGFEISKANPTTTDPYIATTVFGLVGALAGFILTPYFTTRPARALRSLLGRTVCRKSVRRADGIGRRLADRGSARLSALAPAQALWAGTSRSSGFWFLPILVFHSL